MTSTRQGNVVHIETSNVRSMVIESEPLLMLGIGDIVVDGREIELGDMAIQIGPTEGKRPGQYGPFNEAFRKPFCFVYTDDDSQDARTAGFMTTYWALIGNGHACGLRADSLPDADMSNRNLIRLGNAAEPIKPAGFDWDETGILLGDDHFPDAALLFVHPEGDGLSAGMVGSPGMEYLLRQIVPFSSRGGLPDYIIFGNTGAHALGFFDAMWQYDPEFGQP